MAERAAKVRLFVEADLGPGARIALAPDQAHYLLGVMRLGEGARVAAFNGRDGEWICGLAPAGRRAGALVVEAPGRKQRRPPDLWLLFAPVKKARTDFIVEKAAELGVAAIQPVFTRLTNAERLNPDRLRAHAIEAAEQCGETWVPDLAAPVRLEALLDRWQAGGWQAGGWQAGRRLMFCDEARDAAPAAEALAAEALAASAQAGAAPGPWAILIGPEGGFAPEEAARLRAMPSVLRVTLGPRVLRADTAAVAAITLWQAALGDWR